MGFLSVPLLFTAALMGIQCIEGQKGPLTLHGVTYHCHSPDAKLTHREAQNYCRSKGMRLSMPKTKKIMSAIWIHCGIKTHNPFWVGGRREPAGNYFRWDDGEVIDKSDPIWHPINKGGSGDGDCLDIIEGGQLNDLTCNASAKRTVVCQK